MTALCGGGTSSPIPGSPVAVQLAAVAVDALLTDAGMPWLIPLLTFFELPVLDVPTLCATDPPALPTFTADDALVLVRPWDASSANIGTVTAKIAALVQHLGWYAFCRCDVGSPTPLPNPATPAPTGLPTLVGGTAGFNIQMRAADCKVLDLHGGGSVLTPPTGWDSVGFNDSGWSTPVAVPFDFTVNTTGLLGNFGINPNCIANPPNSEPYLAPWHTPPVGNEQFLVRWRFQLPTFDYTRMCASPYAIDALGGFSGWSSGSITINGHSAFGVFSGSNYVGHMSDFVTGANVVAFWVNNGNTGGATTWGTGSGIGYALTTAGGLGSAANPGCCPPDPSIMQLLRSILESTTLVQRQAAPFGYVPGVVHSGLTGTGQISVSDLIGALVTVTASGPVTGEEAGTPVTLFEAGWFNWGNADGFSERIRLSGDTQVSLPAAAGQYTRIGYTLPVGMTIQITELNREP